MRPSVFSVLTGPIRPEVTFLGSNIGDQAGAWNLVVTLSSNPPIGSLLVIGYTGKTTYPTISDNQGNTFTTRVTQTTANAQASRITTAPVVTSSGTHTVTAAYGSSSYGGIAVCCANKINSSPIGATIASTSTGTSVSAALGKRTANNMAVVGVMMHEAIAGTTMTPGTGWTQMAELNEDNSGPGTSLNMIYQIFSFSAVNDPGWIISNSGVWAAVALEVLGK